MVKTHVQRQRRLLAGLVITGLLVGEVTVAGAQPSTPTPTTPGRTTQYGVVHDPAFAALPGATAESGYYAGGAYRIEVPSAWNGALVMYAHGYRGEGPDILVGDSPIRQHLIEDGWWLHSNSIPMRIRPHSAPS